MFECSKIYNVAVGDLTTLKQLFELVRQNLVPFGISVITEPEYREHRVGDVRHSKADISKAKRLLGYSPEINITEGAKIAMPWYVNFLNTKIDKSIS